jgi:diguanylate cyclase (GGDEF)-like protein
MSSTSRLEALRRLPREPAAFYAITDMDFARRVGGALWIFGALVIALMLPFAPPTQHVGDSGWAAAAGVVVLCAASAVPLLRWPDRVSPDALLVMSFLAAGTLTFMVWIGGHAYAPVFMIPVMYASAVHPPRRVLAVFAAVGIGLVAPLLYDGWEAELAGETLAQLLLWFSLALATMLFAATMKLERVDLLADEQEASQLARRDPLTGLGNRRAFDEALERVAAGARRTDRPLSLVIADIEAFKSVNDTYGHLEGDRCLREVAAVLAATVRPSDACYRWGGDEFAVILPSTDAEQAGAVVERVAQAVAERVAYRGAEPMQLRYGVAEIQPDMDAAELVAAADLALMAARSRK